MCNWKIELEWWVEVEVMKEYCASSTVWTESRWTGFSYRGKTCLSLHFRKTLIEGTFLSDMDCVDANMHACVYKQAPAAPLKPLDPLYHYTLRFLTDDGYYCELHALSQYGVIDAAFLIFKVITVFLPSYITSLLSFNVGPQKTLIWLDYVVGVGCLYWAWKIHFFSLCTCNMENMQNNLRLTLFLSIGQFEFLISPHFTSSCSCFSWIICFKF